MFLFGLVEAALGKNPTPSEVNYLVAKMEEEGVRSELASACEEAIMSTFDEEELAHLVNFFDSEMGRKVLPKLGNFATAATPPVMRILGRIIAANR